MTTTEKKKQSQAWGWFEYLGEGMDKEPRTVGDMIVIGFKSVFRLFVFICWLALKPIRWILRKIFRRGSHEKEGDYYRLQSRMQGVDNMFGRRKKKEQNPYMNPYAPERVRFAPPPAIPSHLADQQLGYPVQVQPYPPAQQQPYPPAQQQAYPQPSPAPPAQQEQSYEPQRMVPNPFIELDKSFEQIQDAFSNVHARILDIERDLDNVFERLNMLQGVQSRPTRTIRFRN